MDASRERKMRTPFGVPWLWVAGASPASEPTNLKMTMKKNAVHFCLSRPTRWFCDSRCAERANMLSENTAKFALWPFGSMLKQPGDASARFLRPPSLSPHLTLSSRRLLSHGLSFLNGNGFRDRQTPAEKDAPPGLCILERLERRTQTRVSNVSPPSEILKSLGEGALLLRCAVEQCSLRLGAEFASEGQWRQLCVFAKRGLRASVRVLLSLEKNLCRPASSLTPRRVEDILAGEEHLHALCALLHACALLLEQWTRFQAERRLCGLKCENEFLHLSSLVLWAASPIISFKSILCRTAKGRFADSVNRAVVDAALRVVSVHPERDDAALDMKCLSLTLYSLERLTRQLCASNVNALDTDFHDARNALLKMWIACLARMTGLLHLATSGGVSGQTAQVEIGSFHSESAVFSSRSEGWLRPGVVSLLALCRVLEAESISLVEEECLVSRGASAQRTPMTEVSRDFLVAFRHRLLEGQWVPPFMERRVRQEDGMTTRHLEKVVLELSGRDLSLIFRCLTFLRFFDTRLMRRLYKFIADTPFRCGRFSSVREGEVRFSVQDAALLLWACGALNAGASRCLYTRGRLDGVEGGVSLERLEEALTGEALIRVRRSLKRLTLQVVEEASKTAQSELGGVCALKKEERNLDCQALANAFWGAACVGSLSKRTLREFFFSKAMRVFRLKANKTERRQFLYAALSVLLRRSLPSRSLRRKRRELQHHLQPFVTEEQTRPSALQRRIYSELRQKRDPVSQACGEAESFFTFLQRYEVLHERSVEWGISVDIALLRKCRKRNKKQNFKERDAAADTPPRRSLPRGRRVACSKVAMEVQGPSHYSGEWTFMANAGCTDTAKQGGNCGAQRQNLKLREDGASSLKRRLLRLLGWQVVSLSFAEWQNLEGRPEMQRKLLMEKLKPVIEPREALARRRRRCEASRHTAIPTDS